MYNVPLEIPKKCNKCPFGHCVYSYPLEMNGQSTRISNIDGKENKEGTYGYVCNVEFAENGKYTKVLRAECFKDIKKPSWCGLKEVHNERKTESKEI